MPESASFIATERQRQADIMSILVKLINLLWACTKLHFKGETYQFRDKGDSSLQKDRDREPTCHFKIKNTNDNY